MANLEDLGEVISTDTLIVGGGISGLVAAIKAKENPVDVLVVDEATIGWAGEAPKTGGILWIIAPEDNLDNFVEHQVRNKGDYLNDRNCYMHIPGNLWGRSSNLRSGESRLKRMLMGN